MTKKEIQRKRMMRYFIDAAADIIEDEGIKGITIRKVADLAGYNSATLYNYFESLDHLIFFASMTFVKEYAYSLGKYTDDAIDSLDKFLKIWRCFCDYSYRKPEIYYAIFFAKLDNHLEDYVKEYYSLYPEDLGKQPKDLSTMLLKHNIYDRGMTTLESCVVEGFIKREELVEVNEMTLLIYQGMLSRVINKKVSYEEAVERTMKYIQQSLKSYCQRALDIKG